MTLAKSHTRMIEGDFGSGGSSTYSTRAAAIAATIDGDVNFIQTDAYATTGDQGGATYARAASEPSHAGKLQSSDGAWWEYYADETGARRVNVRAFGALGDGVNAGTINEGNWSGTDDTASFQAAEVCAKTIGYQRWIPKGNYIITGAITSNDSLGLQRSSNVHWKGESREESVIVDKYIKGPFDNIWGYIGTADDDAATTVTLTNGISRGEDTITVNDASLLEPRMWVHVTNHSAPVFDPLRSTDIGGLNDFAAVSDGITSTTTNFSTDARYAVNELIYIGGSADWDSFDTAANNGRARISAVSANKITLTDLPAGWAADTGTGKTIRIKFRDDAIAVEGYPAQVHSVNTTTNEVKLNQSAEFGMSAYVGTGADGKVAGTTLKRFTAPCENILFEDFTITSHAMPYVDAGTDPTHTNLIGKLIQVVHGVNLKARNVTFLYPRAYELTFNRSIDVAAENTKTFSDDLGNLPRYSINFGSCCFGTISGHKQFGGRHAVDGGGRSDGIEGCHILVHDCYVTGTYGAAMGTHHGTRAWEFTDNILVGVHETESGANIGAGMAGVQARGRQHKITNNNISGFTTGVFVIYSDDQTVSGNDIEGCTTGIQIGSSNVANIFNNNIRRSKDNDIYIDAEHRYHSMESLRFFDNKLLSDPSVASFTFESGTIQWSDTWKLVNNYIPNASTQFSNVNSGHLNEYNRTGGTTTWYAGDGATHRMKWTPATDSFLRHVLELRGANFGIQLDSDELVRFRSGEFISYKPINGGFLSYSESNIESITAGCNTTNKFAGRTVYDTTNNCLAVASGSAANAVWHSAKTGVTYATPS